MQQDPSSSEEITDFTPHEIGNLQKELTKLLRRKPKVEKEISELPLDRFLNCPSSLEVDRRISNALCCKSDDKEEHIKKTLKVDLLPRLALEIPFKSQEWRRTKLHKKIYTQNCSRTSFMAKCIEEKKMTTKRSDDESDETSGDASKWVKTDSEWPSELHTVYVSVLNTSKNLLKLPHSSLNGCFITLEPWLATRTTNWLMKETTPNNERTKNQNAMDSESGQPDGRDLERTTTTTPGSVRQSNQESKLQPSNVVMVKRSKCSCHTGTQLREKNGQEQCCDGENRRRSKREHPRFSGERVWSRKKGENIWRERGKIC
ncbi:hypothetical protein V8G54_008856 [Vigna mungo]|uniref:Uncharacterized protein n=1 Tax=Vigna mungo TaxID=3915 RepID=A0AAQ3S6W1_VIGMU